VDSADLHDVQAAHLLRSLRVAAALRIAVVVIMLGAMLLATERYEWFTQSILLACYAVGAITVAVLVFFRIGVTAVDQRLQLITAVGDVTAIAIFARSIAQQNSPQPVEAAARRHLQVRPPKTLETCSQPGCLGCSPRWIGNGCVRS
jgi:hypothetical protein